MSHGTCNRRRILIWQGNQCFKSIKSWRSLAVLGYSLPFKAQANVDPSSHFKQRELWPVREAQVLLNPRLKLHSKQFLVRCLLGYCWPSWTSSPMLALIIITNSHTPSGNYTSLQVGVSPDHVNMLCTLLTRHTSSGMRTFVEISCCACVVYSSFQLAECFTMRNQRACCLKQ